MIFFITLCFFILQHFISINAFMYDCLLCNVLRQICFAQVFYHYCSMCVYMCVFSCVVVSYTSRKFIKIDSNICNRMTQVPFISSICKVKLCDNDIYK